MTETQKLLAEFVETGSEAAFGELVARYVDLVYSAAVRLVEGRADLAEDVTQTVFVDLARKARDLPTDVMLGGWLHRHTCFVANKALRTERRRQSRERQAMEMNADQETEDLAAVFPLLDDALNQLGEQDRTAIILRYFEQRDLRSVGEALGSNEDAARKRVSRALEKLHVLLVRRGVVLSVAGLATALSSQTVLAAPLGMAAAVSGAALAGAATGSAIPLTLMSITKLKSAVVGAVAVAGVATTVIIHQHTSEKIRAGGEVLRRQTAQVAGLESEIRRLNQDLSQTSQVATDGQSMELQRLRGEFSRLRSQTDDLANLQEKNRRLKAAQNSPSSKLPESPLEAQEQVRITMRDAKDWARALTLYAEEHDSRFPESLTDAEGFLHDDVEAGVIGAGDRFEIVYRGSTSNIAEPNKVIVLREKHARQMPDGKWIKVYGFADGHTQARKEDRNDFSAFESKFIITPSGQ